MPERAAVRHVLDSYGAHEGDEWSGIIGRESLVSDLYALFSADSDCGGCQGQGAHSRACLSPLLALAERVESIGDLLSPVLANRAWRVAEEMRALAARAPAPVPLTREQEIAFRKDWDARVVPSAQASGERGPGNVQSIVGTRDRAES